MSSLYFAHQMDNSAILKIQAEDFELWILGNLLLVD